MTAGGTATVRTPAAVFGGPSDNLPSTSTIATQRAPAAIHSRRRSGAARPTRPISARRTRLCRRAAVPRLDGVGECPRFVAGRHRPLWRLLHGCVLDVARVPHDLAVLDRRGEDRLEQPVRPRRRGHVQGNHSVPTAHRSGLASADHDAPNVGSMCDSVIPRRERLCAAAATEAPIQRVWRVSIQRAAYSPSRSLQPPCRRRRHRPSPCRPSRDAPSRRTLGEHLRTLARAVGSPPAHQLVLDSFVTYDIGQSSSFKATLGDCFSPGSVRTRRGSLPRRARSIISTPHTPCSWRGRGSRTVEMLPGRRRWTCARAATQTSQCCRTGALRRRPNTVADLDSRRWVPLSADSPASPYHAAEPAADVAVFSVVECAGGELTGEALLWGIDLHNRAAHLGVSLRPGFAGRGLSVDVLHVLCRYGFAALVAYTAYSSRRSPTISR